MTKRIILVGMLAASLMGCGSAPKHECKPYTWNGALTEILRDGDPTKEPQIPTDSPDLRGPNRLVTRVCSSTPIFNIHGRFVRYHVECR